MFIVCTLLPQKMPCLCELTWWIKPILIQILIYCVRPFDMSLFPLQTEKLNATTASNPTISNQNVLWSLAVERSWRHAPHLRQDEAVVVGVLGVLGAVLHGVEEQHGHDLRHAAAWRGVTERNEGRLRSHHSSTRQSLQTLSSNA